MRRRDFLQAFGSAAALGPLLAAGLLRPGAALAVSINRAPFEARTAVDALRLIGAAGAETSGDILLKTPELAENGAVVPIEVVSSIPGTTRLAVIIDRNPFPLTLQFSFAPEAVPRFQARVRMAESSRLRIVASAGGRHYTVFREVKVTLGGCGE